MNQSLILVFILLATLSVVNALPHQLSKRETQWGKCKADFPLLGVSISPDPLVQGQEDTFSVSGDFKADSNDLLAVAFFGDPTKDPLYTFPTPVCGAPDLPDCPVESVKMDFKITVPTGLPDPYYVAVVIGDPKAKTVLGCAAAEFSGGNVDSYPIASYPIASYPIASYPIASYPIASYPIASYPIAE